MIDVEGSLEVEGGLPLLDDIEDPGCRRNELLNGESEWPGQMERL